MLWDPIAQRDCWELVRRARRGIWGAGTSSSPRWVWVGITARKRHTFRVNKKYESRIHCLNVSSQVWWWVLNDRARARDHARLRACVHGWVVCLRLVEFESRRQAALVATGRAPPCVVLQVGHFLPFATLGWATNQVASKDTSRMFASGISRIHRFHPLRPPLAPLTQEQNARPSAHAARRNRAHRNRRGAPQGLTLADSALRASSPVHLRCTACLSYRDYRDE